MKYHDEIVYVDILFHELRNVLSAIKEYEFISKKDEKIISKMIAKWEKKAYKGIKKEENNG